MCYTRRKIEGGVGALRESYDANLLKPNGQSRNLHIYGTMVQIYTLLYTTSTAQLDIGIPEMESFVQYCWAQ